MSDKFIFRLSAIFFLSFFFFSSIASAQGLLPECARSATPDCTICDFLKAIENVINLLLVVAFPIGVIVLIAGAVILLTSAGSEERVKTGRKTITSAVIGLLIVLGSWVFLNAILQFIADPKNFPFPWHQIQCQVKKPTFAAPPTAPPVAPEECKDPAKLAAKNNVPYPRTNSAALNTLISCVTSNVTGIDAGQIYTYERTNDLCNYTRGNSTCGACQHKINSCHYGGATGNAGAEGVDFNAAGGNSKERELYDKLKKVESTCGFGYILFEKDHTHVSTNACSGN